MIARPLLLSFAILLGLMVRPAHARDVQTAVVAGGCFWCVEADFESVKGVIEVTSGYTGGRTADPTYYEVARGRTGHYEAVRITYDADTVSLAQLYHLFFRAVDPLDAGGQFCDRGAAYRTAIFVDGDEERMIATRAKQAAREALGRRIVTRILPQGPFYEAEENHQDYYKSDRLTVRGLLPTSRARAYAYYRKACGRDDRVQELWGDEAPFVRADP
ncbi:MAG: peptide-methionine (S)-S-oxide reductase [Rhodobacterales bacterium]|nr:MAG: peptide-methionine (S)-S-oxide reductase [Rhodobacterales bacterium]